MAAVHHTGQAAPVGHLVDQTLPQDVVRDLARPLEVAPARTSNGESWRVDAVEATTDPSKGTRARRGLLTE